jgi:hypothetical protein
MFAPDEVSELGELRESVLLDFGWYVDTEDADTVDVLTG